MQIFSTFEHSIFLEIAITSLEKVGINKEHILAIPLKNRVEERKLFDTLHRADGISLFDKAAALSTALSVIGASVGFTLEWGPIFWGLIGAVGGFVLGFIINYIIYKVIHRKKGKLKGKNSEVSLIIECPREKVDEIENMLWEQLALGVAKVDG